MAEEQTHMRRARANVQTPLDLEVSQSLCDNRLTPMAWAQPIQLESPESAESSMQFARRAGHNQRPVVKAKPWASSAPTHQCASELRQT